MKLLAVFLLLMGSVATPDIRYFRYERRVQMIEPAAPQVCLAVDAPLFSHAARGLADLRLYRDRVETPYVLQTSAAPEKASEQTIAALNLGTRGGQTVFDAAMPASKYGDLQLKVTGQNFIATVAVTGSQIQTGPATKIGTFTIFDLTRQRLGRSTVLHLPDSDFRYLHFRIVGPLRPESIRGLIIEYRSTLRPTYIPVAETTQLTQKGRNTVIEFTVPARVPVDQIEIVPGLKPANFSRNVTVAVTEMPRTETGDASASPRTVTNFGNLLRVHTKEDEHSIDQEQLSINSPQVLFESPSRWRITIDNGDDAPLLPVIVRLQMLERDLCFDQESNGSYVVYYGDPALSAPRYDLPQFFHFSGSRAGHAVMQAEKLNAEFMVRPDARPFTERHPALLWIALLLVIALLGLIALRTARSVRPTRS
ncbi:MAG: DUF3999 family protein [Terracidiphilus sp.]